ncbi:ABC transporter permease [Niastella yeongjuensis]|uniref:ABC transporter permease n=1 Tax=Niastella yeongjuensis TaxID=354355 RepID=A0A1V9E4I3_9BACT|nr:ABC transporter permease [Niastella yeongjuensis]OQP41002.1 ABC transporter permease [Niastella yeongjuensis]SEO95182.1 MacB-like core domain-containing protein [Niastella yeongjuensis]
MFKSYLKIAWRNLLKNKLHSFINITGLATGMAVALLVGLWIWDEVSFDRHFRNHDRLAQVLCNQTDKGETYTDNSLAMPVGEALRSKYGQDLKYVSLASWENDFLVEAGDKKFDRKGMWVQPDFPGMFTYSLVRGNAQALQDPSSVLISQSLANAVFAGNDPLNRIIRLNNQFDLKVAGVFEDLPRNTNFYNVQVLLPWENKANWLNKQTSWNNHCGQLFIQLNDKVDLPALNEKIKAIPTPYIKAFKEEIMLHPFDKLHLYTEFKQGKAVGGRIDFVWLFGIVGVFVLLLACINFMNLSTARSTVRAREVGIRKTIGSLRIQLITQFLGESMIVVCLAFFLAIMLVQLSLPFFNNLADKEIPMRWTNPVFWSLALCFILFTGLIAGSYPAFYLSRFKPVKVLKGVIQTGRFASMPRKILVVVQFTVSVTLIICTIVVFLQINHAKDRPVGYNRAGLITVNMKTPELRKNYNAIRTDLLQSGVVEQMARSSHSATYFPNNNGINWRGKDPAQVVFYRTVTVSPDFGKTINWHIKEGRDFYSDVPTDSGSVVLNEAGAQTTGLKNIVGEIIQYGDKNYTVVGVVDNMVTQSPYEPVPPAIFFLDGYLGIITIRIKPGTPIHQALAKIEPVFKKYNAGNPFEYKFVDNEYAQKFSNETRIGNLATFFASLAIFISCLGLFGLASFITEQRTKEIGVRKVLGASLFNLWHLLSKEFTLLVTISLLIAIPIAWYAMHNWLQDYQYRIEISWWIFVATALGALLITLLTVSFQAIKAAMMKPVKSLKTE